MGKVPQIHFFVCVVCVCVCVCLFVRVTGKRKCAENTKHVLKVLTDLLGHENQEVLFTCDVVNRFSINFKLCPSYIQKNQWFSDKPLNVFIGEPTGI